MLSSTSLCARIGKRLLEIAAAINVLATASGAVSPLSSIPALHSNPGAAASLFLDFDGNFEPVYGAYNNITTPAYDLDGDAISFSDHELSNIQAIWQGVAEDYAPFNIDVTTVEPAVLAAGTPIANANGVALRMAIGGTADWYAPGSTGYGGISYIGAFTNGFANVAYVFGANKDKNISQAEIVSHEAGHAFGLDHQAGAATASWQSIMYAVGGLAFSTWYDGPVTTGGPPQDDMAILAGSPNGLGYRSDDHGDTRAHATPLSNAGATWSGAGIVGTNSDVDMFSFTVAVEDTYRLVVHGDAVSPNLDAVLELRGSNGGLLTSASPPDSLNAEILRELAPGKYFLAVKSSGTYGWIGHYSVTIDTPLPGDFNNNGIVDAADYVVWRNGLGTTYTQADYDTWRANFGQTAGSGAALPSAEPLSAGVPEPATLVLLLLGILASINSRRAGLSSLQLIL